MNDKIHSAVVSNDLDSMKQFIQEGMDMNFIISKYTSPLQSAVNTSYKSGTSTMVELLLENGANPNFELDIVDPLKCAIHVKNPEVVKLLVKYGAKVDRLVHPTVFHDVGHITCIEHAALRCDFLLVHDGSTTDTLECLLKFAESLEVTSKSKSIDDTVAKISKPEIVKVLAEHGLVSGKSLMTHDKLEAIDKMKMICTVQQMALNS